MSELRSNRSSYRRSISNLSTPERSATAAVREYEFHQFDDPFSLGSSSKYSNGRRYSAAIPVVICRVCENKIPLIGYDLEDHYIVKCGSCKEATPIRPAPPGEKYIRCVCNCLLICRKTAAKVACPRLNCQRIITVVNQDSSDGDQEAHTATQPPPGTCRLICAHCKQPFIFNIVSKSLTKCPYCYKISAIDDNHRTKELRKSIILAVVFVVMALAIIIGNSLFNEPFTGNVTLYLFVSAIALLSCIRPILALLIRTSKVQGFV